MGAKADACMGAQFGRSVLFFLNKRDLSTTFEVTHKTRLSPLVIDIKCEGLVSDETQQNLMSGRQINNSGRSVEVPMWRHYIREWVTGQWQHVAELNCANLAGCECIKKSLLLSCDLLFQPLSIVSG